MVEGIIGRLVSNDQRGAMIMAELLEVDPRTGAKLDYREVGSYLEKLRAKYEKDGIKVQIIGFAKIVDDMTNASLEVAGFFGLTLVITGLLLWIYCGSFKLGLIPLGSSVVAVIWEMGLLRTVGAEGDDVSDRVHAGLVGLHPLVHADVAPAVEKGHRQRRRVRGCARERSAHLQNQRRVS